MRNENMDGLTYKNDSRPFSTLQGNSRTSPGPLAPEHAAWLMQFARAVRNRDFAAGRALCDGGISAFGTVAFRASDLDDLESGQWQIVWNSTRDFDFDYVSAISHVESSLAVLLTTWRSVGIDKAENEVERRGRATVVLQFRAGRWLAVHTHFSLMPKS